MQKILPHNQSIESLVKFLRTDLINGLKRAERRKRLYVYGQNKLPHEEGISLISLFISQFKDFMILVLMGATLISAIMGHIEDALTIMSIIVLNSILGFIQEYRAERSLKALQDLTAPKARVIEEGKINIVPATELVIGDVILLEAGDRIPADGRLIESNNLQVDEAILSGESLPVDKDTITLEKKQLPPGEKKNMVFMGTLITKGRGKAIVTATGLETEIGKIASMIKSSENGMTPLQKRLYKLGKWLVLGCLGACAAVVILGIIQGGSIFQMLLAGVSLAVAAIPEGLPAIITVSLALGVQRMAKRKAIVRKLSAVETLGCTTVICSDKTGTITKNQMELEEIYTDNRLLPKTSWKKNLRLVELPVKIGIFCNGARFKNVKVNENKKTGDEFIGDPTEIALLKAAVKMGWQEEIIKKDQYNLLEIPFDSKRKRMSVINRDEPPVLYIKGATEEILKRSDWIWLDGKKKRLTQSLKNKILKENDRMTGKALRVLAVGYRILPSSLNLKEINDLSLLERELVFVGLLGLLDPPRPEVKNAIKMCRKAGIKPIMVTGDHPNTALAIARKVGLIENNAEVILGEEIDQMNLDELAEVLTKASIFSRVSPENKLKIVKALKKSGEVVAMTGDGVNDAPALKAADIGVAMGQKGSEVTREAAALVLGDDNFSTIIAAAEEGRGIYENIRKFIRYLLSCNIGEIITIFFGMALGWPLPLLPIQILFVNLVTDGLPALALGVEPISPDVMLNPPRSPEEGVFSRGLGFKILIQGILMGISTLFSFAAGYFIFEGGIELARTLAFSTLVLAQLFFAFSCRREKGFIWKIKPWENVYLCLAVLTSLLMQLFVIYHPLGGRLFSTVPLSLEHWFIISLCAFWSPVLLSLVQRE